MPDERLETFAGFSCGFAGAKVSSAKTVRLGHAAVELWSIEEGEDGLRSADVLPSPVVSNLAEPDTFFHANCCNVCLVFDQMIL